MKALTAYQPHASLIAIGAKRIEALDWSTTYRGSLAIHAAAAMPAFAVWACFETPINDALARGGYFMSRGRVSDVRSRPREELPLGAIVAMCDLIDVVPIVEWGADPQQNHITVGKDGRLRSYEFVVGRLPLTWRIRKPFDVSHEQLFGDFTPGRYAWLLDNIVALKEPISAKGRQRLWDWKED